jgi:hypothetical protein
MYDIYMNKKLIKTLCTDCLSSLECEWPEIMNWGTEEVSAEEYMANSLNSDTHRILCDDCMDILMTNPQGVQVEYI